MTARKTPKRPSATRRPSSQRPEPEVWVDFTFDRGLMHVVVENGGESAAYGVSVRFSPSFRGLGGAHDVSSLALFRCIEFLAPHRRIETFLDASRDYFARDEPRRITADITYRDREGRTHARCVQHDLGIYEDLSWLLNADRGSSGSIRDEPRPAGPSATPGPDGARFRIAEQPRRQPTRTGRTGRTD
ncbi:MAG: hypothetical protein IT361_04670 [Gemmatimonadaceae bacterium]|nr:hypothetical protein [Gemmatimonadaceae bacterium]